MLYTIDNKCYVNIAPSIYIEVVISEDGKITPTKNKIEANADTKINTITIADWLKRNIETETFHKNYEMDRKYNRRNKK